MAQVDRIDLIPRRRQELWPRAHAACCPKLRPAAHHPIVSYAAPRLLLLYHAEALLDACLLVPKRRLVERLHRITRRAAVAHVRRRGNIPGTGSDGRTRRVSRNEGSYRMNRGEPACDSRVDVAETNVRAAVGVDDGEDVNHGRAAEELAMIGPYVH